MLQPKNIATLHTSILLLNKTQKTRILIYNEIIKDSIKLVYDTG